MQVGDTYKLSIAKVGVRDYGEYYCRASNLLDRDVSTAMVLTGEFVIYVAGDRNMGKFDNFPLQAAHLFR